MKLKFWMRRAGVALLGLTFAAIGQAQDYPSRSVKIIVPYAAGGQGDSSIRIVANALSQSLGQTFVVENIAGSSGISAVQTLMRAPADGYTLMYNDNGHWAINPALFKTLPYDTLRDLAPVGLFAQSSLFLVANASFPANNLQELVAAIKAKPDAYSYASSGVGSIIHLLMEYFCQLTGTSIRHIPFSGAGPAKNAVTTMQISAPPAP